MSDIKKIGLLFLVCLILAVYSKMSGNTPDKLGNILSSNGSNSNVLGTQSSKPSFANLVPK